MHKNAKKCNKTQSKWCKNKHGASKIIDTFETYHNQNKKKRKKRGTPPWFVKVGGHPMESVSHGL
jgi:hypothetical protein